MESDRLIRRAASLKDRYFGIDGLGGADDLRLVLIRYCNTQAQFSDLFWVIQQRVPIFFFLPNGNRESVLLLVLPLEGLRVDDPSDHLGRSGLRIDKKITLHEI